MSSKLSDGGRRAVRVALYEGFRLGRKFQGNEQSLTPFGDLEIVADALIELLDAEIRRHVDIPA
jgi:hypothetical protein